MSEPETTPPLAEFRAKYDADDNEWWRLSSGHHQNLFDAACWELDDTRAELAQLRADYERAIRCADAAIRMLAAVVDPADVLELMAELDARGEPGPEQPDQLGQ